MSCRSCIGRCAKKRIIIFFHNIEVIFKNKKLFLTLLRPFLLTAFQLAYWNENGLVLKGVLWRTFIVTSIYSNLISRSPMSAIWTLNRRSPGSDINKKKSFCILFQESIVWLRWVLWQKKCHKTNRSRYVQLYRHKRYGKHGRRNKCTQSALYLLRLDS